MYILLTTIHTSAEISNICEGGVIGYVDSEYDTANSSYNVDVTEVNTSRERSYIIPYYTERNHLHVIANIFNGRCPPIPIANIFRNIHKDSLQSTYTLSGLK